jgi:hypothetical protein
MMFDLENLDRSLCAYLDQKRNQVSRLYFTSNEELIEWMGQLKNVKYLEVFLAKLFEGVGGLRFRNETNIVGYTSQTGETISLNQSVSTRSPPEVWLGKFEEEMKRTMYVDMHKCLKDYLKKKDDDLLSWILRWPGQIVIVVLHIVHKNCMDRVFDAEEPDYSLLTLYQEILGQIEFLASLVRKEIDANCRITIHNMMINRVHARDSVN